MLPLPAEAHCNATWTYLRSEPYERVYSSTMQYLSWLPGLYVSLDSGPYCSRENASTPAMLRQASKMAQCISALMTGGEAHSAHSFASAPWLHGHACDILPLVTLVSMIAGLPERRASSPFSEAQPSTSAACNRKLEITALPVDVLRMMSQELPTAVTSLAFLPDSKLSFSDAHI